MFLNPASTVGFQDKADPCKDAERQVIKINISFELVVKMILPGFDCESIIIIFAASERLGCHNFRNKILNLNSQKII